jgi:very-short-patch-repair endonuclease
MLRQWVADGVLERSGRDVYVVLAVPRSPEQRVLVACKLAGPSALATRRTAEALHHFDGFGPLDRVRAMDILVPATSNFRSRDTNLHRSDTIESQDRCFVGPIPTTSPVRTLIDLGAVVSREQLEEALDGAERDGKVNRRVLERRLGELRQHGRRGTANVAAILDGRARMERLPRTVLERRMLRLLERAGLPLPVCQYPVMRRNGRTAFLDFAYVALLVAIEVDGNGSHATPAQRASDNQRSNELTGWRVLRFTYEDVTHRGAYVADTVGSHLSS